MGLAPTHPGAALPFFCHNGVGEHLSQPPPAHMGIPPYQLDPKGAGTMGEYWRGPPGAPASGGLSAAEWKRLGPLLAATGTHHLPGVKPTMHALSKFSHSSHTSTYIHHHTTSL